MTNHLSSLIANIIRVCVSRSNEFAEVEREDYGFTAHWVWSQDDGSGETSDW